MMLAMLLAIAFAPNAAPTEVQLSTRNGDEDVIPAYFRGTWGQSLKACADDEGTGTIIVSATRIVSYELDARLLKTSIIGHATRPGGGESHYVELLLASSGEGKVQLSTAVLSRVKDTRYFSWRKGTKDLTDAEQYENPYIFCPVRAK